MGRMGGPEGDTEGDTAGGPKGGTEGGTEGTDGWCGVVVRIGGATVRHAPHPNKSLNSLNCNI